MLQRELFDILEGTADAAFAVNEQGIICSWNSAAEKTFGWTKREALDKPCVSVFEGRDGLETPVCTEHCAVLECSAQHRPIPNYDVEFLTRSDERIWVNISILVFHDQRTGQRLAVHLARDIGNRKKREDLAQRLVGIARQLTSLPVASGTFGPLSPLSRQEGKILRMLAHGKSPEAVAQELQITRHTLRNHLYRANRKLHTRNRLEAVLQATQRGLI